MIRFMEDLLTAQEAAVLLHLHVKQIQALARAGRLPGVRVGRKWLFPRQQLMTTLRGSLGDRHAVEISARNQLRGRVKSMSVDGIMAEVHIQIGQQELVSVITRASVERLGIRVGDEVVALIKATEVMVGKP